MRSCLISMKSNPCRVTHLSQLHQHIQWRTERLWTREQLERNRPLSEVIRKTNWRQVIHLKLRAQNLSSPHSLNKKACLPREILKKRGKLWTYFLLRNPRRLVHNKIQTLRRDQLGTKERPLILVLQKLNLSIVGPFIWRVSSLSLMRMLNLFKRN